MKSLYSACVPYAVHHLGVDETHEIYVEECGNPQGFPVLFLHGGPGSGCSTEHRRYFDPKFYRIVLFDQRGSGKSLPLGEVAQNRTSDLVTDMEVIRHHLAIDRWLLFGGSWGATLALVYALAYPGSFAGLILRGTFLARKSDVDWFFIGLRRIFPQAWKEFSEGMADPNDAQTLIDGYYAMLQGEDPDLMLHAAHRWSEWGGVVVNWHKTPSAETADAEAESAVDHTGLLAKVRIETHYAHHRYFIEENEILDRIGSLPAIPVSILHGRYDLTCTLEAAWALHQAIPGSRLVQVSAAGHLIDDPAMISALIEETERMRALL